MHPFHAPWKHQKTLQFSDAFKGKRKGGLGTNGLIPMNLQLSFTGRLIYSNVAPEKNN